MAEAKQRGSWDGYYERNPKVAVILDRGSFSMRRANKDRDTKKVISTSTTFAVYAHHVLFAWLALYPPPAEETHWGRVIVTHELYDNKAVVTGRVEFKPKDGTGDWEVFATDVGVVLKLDEDKALSKMYSNVRKRALGAIGLGVRGEGTPTLVYAEKENQQQQRQQQAPPPPKPAAKPINLPQLSVKWTELYNSLDAMARAEVDQAIMAAMKVSSEEMDIVWNDSGADDGTTAGQFFRFCETYVQARG